MTNERWTNVFCKEQDLTSAEISAGWHFCAEWDGLLVGPGMEELEHCLCSEPIPLYSIGTWDTNEQSYMPQADMRNPCINVDIHGLRRALTELRREHGYAANRIRFDNGERDSDWSVLVERTDGMPVEEILKQWER